jgi:hypothetical protein
MLGILYSVYGFSIGKREKNLLLFKKFLSGRGFEPLHSYEYQKSQYNSLLESKALP